jgi:SAM-dependent methyltransferase
VIDLADLGALLSFRLRNTLRLSAPAWRWPARRFERALVGLDEAAQARAAELRERFDLEAWPRLLDVGALREALYTLDLLVQHLPSGATTTRGLDVGAKHGLTLPALVAARPGPWDLVELDAHRRYLDLSTRRAHGERMAGRFRGCRYLAGSVLHLHGPYDVVTWFLPFVHEGPLAAWGLPRRFFEPERLLRHVTGLVAPGGSLLVVNQGEAERDTQAALFEGLGVRARSIGRIESLLSPFQRPRFGFLWRRIPGP